MASPIFDVQGLLFAIFGIICILPPLIHLIVSDKNAQIKFKRIDTATSILSIFCYLMFSIQYSILSIYGILYNETDQFSASVCIPIWWSASWRGYGNLFTTLFFISRLYKTFHGSAFALSYKKFKMSMIAFTMCNVTASISISATVIRPMYAIIFKSNTPIIESINSYEECSLLLDAFWPKRLILLFTAVAIYAIADITTIVVLLRVYLKKCVLLSIACNEINSLSQLQTKHMDKKNRHILRQNALFLSLSEKTTMIVILLSMSYCIGCIVAGIQLRQQWLILDNIIRSWCVYMTYTCAKKMYNIICFKGELCFEGLKYCCFCCCKINALPPDVQLIINPQCVETPTVKDISVGTPPAAQETTKDTGANSGSAEHYISSLKLDSSEKRVCVPRLRMMSMEGLFLDTDADYSYSSSAPGLTRLPSNSPRSTNQMESNDVDI